jgi:hypothetical protein
LADTGIMHYPSPRRETSIANWLHVVQGTLTLAAFVVAIARLAFYGGPRSRTDVWIIAVVSEAQSCADSYLFLL